MIKSFKDFLNEGGSGYDASDLDKEKDKKSSGSKKLEPKAKGEKDFANAHKMTKTKHPVAGDHQFDGDRREIKEDESSEDDDEDDLAESVIDIFTKAVEDAGSRVKQLKVKFDNGKSETLDTGIAKEVLEKYNKLGSSQKKSLEKLLSKSPDSFFKTLDTILD